MKNKITFPKDIAWYTTDMFWVWIQVRNLYENIKNKIKSLISK